MLRTGLDTGFPTLCRPLVSETPATPIHGHLGAWLACPSTPPQPRFAATIGVGSQA